MTRRARPLHDLRLKIAILESRRTQRWLAIETRIGETRLSEIVGHRGSPPSPVERERILRDLNRVRVARVLPVLAATDVWTPEELAGDAALAADAQGAA